MILGNGVLAFCVPLFVAVQNGGSTGVKQNLSKNYMPER
jgi:hypothetical protein